MLYMGAVSKQKFIDQVKDKRYQSTGRQIVRKPPPPPPAKRIVVEHPNRFKQAQKNLRLLNSQIERIDDNIDTALLNGTEFLTHEDSFNSLKELSPNLNRSAYEFNALTKVVPIQNLPFEQSGPRACGGHPVKTVYSSKSPKNGTLYGNSFMKSEAIFPESPRRNHSPARKGFISTFKKRHLLPPLNECTQSSLDSTALKEIRSLDEKIDNQRSNSNSNSREGVESHLYVLKQPEKKMPITPAKKDYVRYVKSNQVLPLKRNIKL